MRKFSSYGQIDTGQHYYAPRTALIEQTYTQLVGDNPEKGGHYITVWAPRQTGKSSVMLEVKKRVQQENRFDIALFSMQSAKEATAAEGVLNVLLGHLRYACERDFPSITTWQELSNLFTATYFRRPVILMIDEFDAIPEEVINKFANAFRDMYIHRASQSDKRSGETVSAAWPGAHWRPQRPRH